MISPTPCRPLRAFLLECTDKINPSPVTYLLAWKHEAKVAWIYAGTPQPSITELDADNASPADGRSLVRDIFDARGFLKPELYDLEARDISNRVGVHHERVSRPELYGGKVRDVLQLSPANTGLEAAALSSVVAANILFRELEDLLSTIEPARAQLSTYGHKLRHLLILACTEVESAWRAVYERNALQPEPRPSTRDYVQLADPMKLREWSVRLTRSTEQLQFSPFASWSMQQPTQTLPWYDAYNATKHGRELHLDRARLDHVLDAAAALYVMLCAQFGEAISARLQPALFTVEQRARWAPHECYIMSHSTMDRGGPSACSEARDIEKERTA